MNEGGTVTSPGAKTMKSTVFLSVCVCVCVCAGPLLPSAEALLRSRHVQTHPHTRTHTRTHGGVGAVRA